MPVSKKVVITGVAGFIGFHLASWLIERGYEIAGLDNLNNYYDVNLKLSRLKVLNGLKGFTFFQVDINNRQGLQEIFNGMEVDCVINLAAQAGVRYSLTNPRAYIDSNISGFLNILEICKDTKVRHLIYASSSSVYGANRKMPFSVHDNVDHPLSLYAASKKANELMAHTYSSLYGLPTTGLRFFTVYGPYGRPDMALFMFTKSILDNVPIDVYNNGRMKRDFTYVDDVTESIFRLIPVAPSGNVAWNPADPDPATSFAPFRIFNVGNNSPVELLRFIEVIEKKLGKKAIMNFLPLQQGDVPETFADVDDLSEVVGFRPRTSIEEGIGNFIDWYMEHYKPGKN